MSHIHGLTYLPIFERFTEPSRQVMNLARAEAERQKLNFIEVRFIALGLLLEAGGTAALVLKNIGADLDRAAQQLRALPTAPSGVPQPSELPFSPEAKRVLEWTYKEAVALRHKDIGTEHLLLGLLRARQEKPIELGDVLGSLKYEEVLALAVRHNPIPPLEEKPPVWVPNNFFLFNYRLFWGELLSPMGFGKTFLFAIGVPQDHYGNFLEQAHFQDLIPKLVRERRLGYFLAGLAVLLLYVAVRVSKISHVSADEIAWDNPIFWSSILLFCGFGAAGAHFLVVRDIYRKMSEVVNLSIADFMA